MEPLPPLRSDPEFRPAFSDRALPRVADPGAYRRILANPFLGLIGIAAWIAAPRQILRVASEFGGSTFSLLCVWLAAAYFLPRLFHYHCLDCGRTGPLLRWKRHVCPDVARRIIEGQARRFRGPSPMVQTLLWLYLLAIALVVARWAGVSLR